MLVHNPHPHIRARLMDGAPTAATSWRTRWSGVNRWLAVRVTAGVSTMWCAYAFLLLTFVSGPAAFASHSPVIMVQWLSSTCLQLVFLPILSVGQAVLSEAGDARAKATFDDATAILSELTAVHDRLGGLEAGVAALRADEPPRGTPD